MTNFKTLPSSHIARCADLGINDLAEPLEMSSPATYVMTDFTRRSPLLIDQDTSIDDALLIMRKTHARTNIVVSDSMDMLGIVALADLLSRKVLMSANLKGVSRQDITVSDVMNNLSDVHAVKYSKLVNASIGDVLTTMQALGEQYLLALDDHNHIRGLICAADIRRALHIPVDISATAQSFKDLFTIIHNHSELN